MASEISATTTKNHKLHPIVCPSVIDEDQKHSLAHKVRHILIGTPIASAHELQHRLDKVRALAIFSSDALSSVAYGPEQVMLTLMLAGTAAMVWGIPITVAVVLLVAIVATSYWQTIHAYPSGGGSFIVARENLGTLLGLTAASSLLIAYVLTVAVSVSAGVSAIVSVFPQIDHFRVAIGVACIMILVLANLRGLKDSGAIFAAPTYIFIFSVLVMIVLGFIRIFILHQDLVVQDINPIFAAAEPLTLWLILRAFSSGAATLTGIEAVADGVPSFKPPESRNAGVTLMIMAGFLGVMALGIIILANQLHAMPTETETVLSQIGRTVYQGIPFLYWILQASTMLILVLAANTAFADFPRLSSILAKYKFMPHQFAFRGDRLAFSTGITILGLLAALLVIIFGGSERYIISLYAVGVFLSFTLSQTGMIFRWRKLRSPGWKRNITANYIGAVTTFIVLIIVSVTKFTQGAWTVIIIIPVFVYVMHRINKHYNYVEKHLEVDEYIPAHYHPKFIVPISKIDKHTLLAIDYVRSITSVDNIIAVHVSENKLQEKTKLIQAKWAELIPDIPLTILESPFRTLIRPLLTFTDNIKKIYGEPVTVVVTDFQPVHWWEHILHTHTSLRMRAAFAKKDGIVIINTHYKLRKNTYQ